MKPTLIWTNLGEWWRPACERKPGWLLECPHCEACRQNRPHDRRIIRRGPEDKRKGPHLPGFSPDAAKNRIAPALAAELARAALERWASKQEEEGPKKKRKKPRRQ